tara:strand:- start:2952 stop:3809 length:858 start_codon:yes stop_codon:yes gene_type:complete
MAINFPSTAGQATDGTFTYVVAGITYSWNGESWTAAGSGATATDLTVFSATNDTASGGGSLSYNSNNGQFTFTPPDLSGYLTSVGSINDHNDVTITSVSDNQLLKYNFSNTRWENWSPNYLTSETDPVFSASEAANITSTDTTQWDTAYGWGNHASAGYLSSMPSRQTAAVTVSSLADGAFSNQSITTAAGYALLTIQTSHAAWVTLYNSTSARSNDASRLETVDPTPGSGVLAEVITAGNVTQEITPGAFCWNSAGTTSYLKIVNKSGSTANVSVTLTFVKLEG